MSYKYFIYLQFLLYSNLLGTTDSLFAQSNWYRCNFHAHSNNSGGTMYPLAILIKYQTLGYECLSITDHNFLAPIEGFSLTNFVPINGEELTFNKHLCAIGLTNTINPQGSLQNNIDLINSQNAIPIIAHPRVPFTFMTFPEIFSLENIYHIEIFNNLFESGGIHDDLSLWDSLLSCGKKIYGMACDDSHQESDIGYAWIMVNSNSFCKDSILTNIKVGNFYSTTGILINQLY